jgi:hypothetical protein
MNEYKSEYKVVLDFPEQVENLLNQWHKQYDLHIHKVSICETKGHLRVCVVLLRRKKFSFTSD